MKTAFRTMMGASASALALGACPALAQQVPTPSPAVPPSAAVSSVQDGVPGASDQTAPETADVGEIVVTALRRSESLQRTPAAVTVVSGDLLVKQKIVDIQGIQNLAPSARFSAANTSTRIFIRGVGSSLDFYWIPETTAVNFNGVYVPRFATTGALYDVQSVQVLPGPQGVLYGKSAGGGAVVVNANRPSQSYGGSGLVEYGNYDTVNVQAMANVPVTDTLAIRAAGTVSRHDGYQSFNLDSKDAASVRLSALWTPAEALDVYLWGTYFENGGRPTAAQYIPQVPGGDAWFLPRRDPNTGLDNSVGSFMDFKYLLAGGSVSYDFGDVAIKYSGGYLHQTEEALRKLVGNDQVIDNEQRQYTQSLQVTAKLGDLELIAGVDWFYARSRHSVLFGPRQFGQIFPLIKNRSASGFGQATYALTPGLRLIGGARYTRDKIEADGVGSACFAACFYPPITFSDTFHTLDVKGGIEADLAPRVLAYANVQTGYAPGTFNTFTDVSGLDKRVKKQRVLAYTGGVKSTLVGGAVTANVEGFYYDYKDLIIQAFNPLTGNLSLFNAPKAEVYGLQFTGIVRPFEAGTLTANIAWTKSQYGSFVASPGQRDLDGLQLVFTPTWTATIAYDHRFQLASGAHIDARVSSYISSSYWGTFDHSSNARQGAYVKSDASITYQPESEQWSVGAWVKNIENEAVRTALVSSGFGAPYLGTAFIEAPRTYGVSLGFRF